jgi:hypothetical protein
MYKEIPRMLELFCGRKCVGEVFKNDYEVISLDYNPKFNATHTEDILTWDYKIYRPNEFEIIWASPDCTTWSVASGGKYRTKGNILSHHDKGREAERMIDRLLEIINYFNPKIFFIENPRGLLQYYSPMKEIKKTLVYYGNHNWGCPKPTHIWSNIDLWEDEKKPVMDASTYILRYRPCDGRIKREYHTYQGLPEKRSLIPRELIEKIYTKVKEKLNNSTN